MASKKDMNIEDKIRDRFCSEVKDEWLYNRQAVIEGRLCKEACEEVERLRKVASKYEQLRTDLWRVQRGYSIDGVIRELELTDVHFPSVALTFNMNDSNNYAYKKTPELNALSELYKTVAVETEKRAQSAVKDYEKKTDVHRKALINTLKKFQKFLNETNKQTSMMW